MKRIFCTILAVMMALGVCGMTAIAEEATTATDGTTEEEISSITNAELTFKEVSTVTFKDQLYSEMCFKEAVNKGYIGDYSSLDTGFSTTVYASIEAIVLPDGQIIIGAGSFNSRDYNELAILFSDIFGARYFVKLVREGFDESTVKDFFQNSMLEVTTQITVDTISFENSEFTESKIDPTVLYTDGRYFGRDKTELDAGITIRLFPMGNGMLKYTDERLNYWFACGLESTSTVFYIDSNEGTIIAAILASGDEVIEASNFEENIAVCISNIDQHCNDGETFYILFKTLDENCFYVKLTLQLC